MSEPRETAETGTAETASPGAGEGGDRAQPLVAGVVAALVGFGGAFTVVLAGLRAVGADPAQATSGLMFLSVAMGACAIFLALRTRMPVAVAWSTPGAALLVASGEVEGGYPAALGAFLVCGLLIALAGFWGALGRWIGKIPPALASAMLAGVLLPLCLAPARAVVELPLVAGPIALAWALLMVFARRWALPGTLAVAVVAIVVDTPPDLAAAALAPNPVFTAPVFDAGTIVGLAIPLFLVTMASQNITGMGVLASFGYRPPLRPVLVSTGAATAAIAPFGGHAVNLAAITAALVAGPDAGPDRTRRWLAAVTNGAACIALGLAAGVATALISAAPELLIEAVAGLALLGALAGAVAAAMADAERRDAAIVTLVVSASGITAVGITAPFWGLTAGLALLALARFRPTPAAERP